MKNTYIFNLFVLIFLSSAALICSNSQLNSVNAANPSQLSDIQLLESLENAFVRIAARSKPAVVSITAHQVVRKGVQPWNPPGDLIGWTVQVSSSAKMAIS